MTIWDITRNLGGFAGTAIVVVAAVYAYPHSPLRQLVERWIDRRVGQRFDKELEKYRHQLTLDAETVRAEHQRLLHNAALVTERKHEVFRELFRLNHIAVGAASHLFGLREEPNFEEYRADDIRAYMTSLGIPGGFLDQVVGNWDAHRHDALEQLSKIRRRVEINEADRAYADASNYYLTNSLYLPDSISQKAAQVFEPLREIVAIAKFPEGVPHREIGELRVNTVDRLEELRLLLRAELRVLDGPQQ